MKNEVMEAMMMGAREINRLRNENQKLQERIDKATKYIEEDIKGNYFRVYYAEIYDDCEKLLEILKGEDK